MADLVPKPVLTAWLKHLREELPTIPFKASTQQQAQNLGRRSSAAQADAKGSDCIGEQSWGCQWVACGLWSPSSFQLSMASYASVGSTPKTHLYLVGADMLLQLLKNYARNAGLKSALTVGVVGLPNVGKSSVINSLKRSRVAQVIDCAGIRNLREDFRHKSVLLPLLRQV